MFIYFIIHLESKVPKIPIIIDTTSCLSKLKSIIVYYHQDPRQLHKIHQYYNYCTSPSIILGLWLRVRNVNFSTKTYTYVVGSQKNRQHETVLLIPKTYVKTDV